MTYLITGGCGFLGTNIGEEILNKGKKLIIFDNLYREGSIKNLEYLKNKSKDFIFHYGDIRNKNDVENAILLYKPDIIYHLAGQVAMTTSISNPQLDFEVNALGTFNLLDSIRKYKNDSIVIYSSTNKVYGDLEQYTYEETSTRYICKDYKNGFDENVPLDFHSPYGCSKGSGDSYMLDFHRIFGIRSIVFRHSSMYGGRQFATIDQGWIGYFIKEALNKRKISISGNGKQVRDILHSNDMVRLYLDAPNYIDKMQGKAFNIGGGVENSLSILELFAILEELLDIKITYSTNPPRASDQRVFIANLDKIKTHMPISIEINKIDGIKKMIDWVKKINT